MNVGSHETKRRLVIGVLAVTLASVCYGITPILSNTLLNGGLPADFVIRVFGEGAVNLLAASETRAMTNESIVAFCMGVACLLSVISCLAARKKLTVNPKQLWQLSLFGGGALCATLLLITYAYVRIPAGMTIVLNFTYPVFVVLAMVLFFKERFTFGKLIPLIAAIFGIALMSNTASGGKADALGILIALSSGVMYAVYFIAGNKSAYAKLDTSVTNPYITGSACIIAVIIALLTGRFRLPHDWFMWLVVFLEALLGYVVGLRLLLTGIRLLGSAAASAINTLEPAFATITSVLVFGEAMGLGKVLGILLVLVAALISILAIAKDKSKQVNLEA